MPASPVTPRRISTNLGKKIYIQGVDATFSISGHALYGTAPIASTVDLMLYNSLDELIFQTVANVDSNGDYVYSQAFGSLLPGIYRVVVSASGLISTTYFTYVKTDSWTTPAFPLEITWRNQIWTLTQDRVLKCSIGRDWIKLTFPTPDNLSGVTQTASVNAMAFRYNLYRVNYIDLDIVFIKSHRGLKFYMRGTQNVQRTFNIQIQSSSPIKRRINKLYIGRLCFDFSDLEKSSIVFTYDNGVLSMTAETSFFMDPASFSDGFESGDTTAWDGTYVDTGCTIHVHNTIPHTGVYGMESTIDNVSEIACVHDETTTFVIGNTYYIRLYVAFPVVPTDNVILMIEGAVEGMKFTLYKSGSDYYWELYNYLSTIGYTWLASPAPLINHYYCMEIKYKIHNTLGELHLYVDGVERITQTGLDTAAAANFTSLVVGNYYSGATGVIYVDDVVVDTSYIGPTSEVVGMNPLPNMRMVGSRVYPLRSMKPKMVV